LLPDIFPVENNTREVDKTAFDGDNYVGLRVSENDEFSCIFHLFDQPIIAGDSLIISLSLARSSVYLIETNGEMVNFATPAVLQIFGMTVDQDILLYNSPLAINTRWLTKTKTIASNEDIIGIKLKAFYQTPSPFPYNGNVLIDNLDFRLKR